MKRMRLLLVFAVLTLLLVSVTLPGSAEGDDTLLVLFRGNGVPADFADQIAALGGEVTYSHEVGFAVVKGVASNAVGKLAKVSDVMPNFAIEFAPTAVSEAFQAEALPASPEDPASAARFSWQWNLVAIDAPEAWAAGYLGSPEVTVAILDTGIDYTYPDLAGLVDLDRSISFVPEDDFYVDLFFPGAHYIADIHWHGTHVAATVASNAYVTAGVTSKTTLMGVKVCSAALGYCPGDAVFAGILYAADNGADVINMSLGGGFFKSEYPGYVSVINKILTYANQKKVTVVVSAGNEALDLDHIPNLYKTYCDAPNTICVSATGPTSADDIRLGPWYEVDAPAVYTNYGRSAINVAAPGGNTGGYVWAACSTFSLVVPVCGTGIYTIGATGTSMASPHVTGLAALLVDQYGKDPGIIREMIQDGADDLGQPGTDPFYGKGRINIFNTVVP